MLRHAAPVLNRFIAVVFILLCASPFTAPFQTWVPLQSHVALAFTSADDNGLASSDLDALTVPPIDSRIGGDGLVSMAAGVLWATDAILLESGSRNQPGEHPQFSPPQFHLTRAVLLRI